jgi:hypothetical protein
MGWLKTPLSKSPYGRLQGLPRIVANKLIGLPSAQIVVRTNQEQVYHICPHAKTGNRCQR